MPSLHCWVGHGELRYGGDTRYHHFADELQHAIVQLRELNRYSGDTYTAIGLSILQSEMDVANDRPEIDPILNPDGYGINADTLGDRTRLVLECG